jgi:hypothetical protein
MIILAICPKGSGVCCIIKDSFWEGDPVKQIYETQSLILFQHVCLSLVVDDGNYDRSSEMVSGLASEKGSLRLLCGSENRGNSFFKP